MSTLMAGLLITCFLSQPATTIAWWNGGHMVIAQIAYDNLKPNVRAEVDRLTCMFGPFEPSYWKFVPSSIWMDSLKRNDLIAFNHWHYIDKPYSDGAPGVGPGHETVAWAISQATHTLGSDRAGDFEKALTLRFLVHLVGDAHQPLHAINRYSHDHKRGDRGGNLFRIRVPGRSDQRSLHAFWDAGANLFGQPNLRKPKQWEGVTRRAADDVTAEVPRKKAPNWKDRNPETWVAESYRIGIETVYADVEPNATLTRAYIKTAQKVVAERLAIAGYRLAALLNDLLGPADPSKGKNYCARG